MHQARDSLMAGARKEIYLVERNVLLCGEQLDKFLHGRAAHYDEARDQEDRGVSPAVGHGENESGREGDLPTWKSKERGRRSCGTQANGQVSLTSDEQQSTKQEIVGVGEQGLDKDAPFRLDRSPLAWVPT